MATGILCGFTSYSSGAAMLWERGAALEAAGQVLASVTGSILAYL